MRPQPDGPGARGAGGALPLEALERCPAPVLLVREDGRLLLANTMAQEVLAQLLGHSIQVGGTLADRAHCPIVQERMSIMRELAERRQGAVIRELVDGEQVLTFVTYIPPGPGEELARFLLIFQRTPGPQEAMDYPGRSFIECKMQNLGALAKLTEREVEILALIEEGLTAAQIAARIFRSEETVNSHKASILKKLGCHNTAQLALVAHRAGLKARDGKLVASPRQRV